MFERDQMEKILYELTRKRCAVEKQLSQYPAGELRVKRQRKKDRNYTYLYIEFPKQPGEVRCQRKNITKDKEMVCIMARKEYLRASMERLNWDIAVLQEAINNLEDTSTEKILSSLDPAIQKEIVFQKQKEYLLPDDPEAARKLMEWINAPYTKNPKNPEHLKHRTSTGEFTRSKSEVLIYEKLKEYKLAYRYDGQLLIGDEAIYPDFTIMRADGKIFYWEHAGRCDLQQYRDEIMWKLRLFESVGIGQWDNLILTFDVEDGKIDMREIERLIQNKLLV